MKKKSWISENIFSIVLLIVIISFYFYLKDTFFLSVALIYTLGLLLIDSLGKLELRILKLENKTKEVRKNG